MNHWHDRSDRFLDALRPHYDDALRYTRALCARWSPSEAEDVLQQSLLKALSHFHELRDPDKFRPWFFRIVTRTFHSAVRRHFWRRFVPLPTDADEAMPAVFQTRPEEGAKMDLMDALATLSNKERSTLLLFEVAGFSIEEIVAVQSERSLSAVKSRLSRARRRMRSALGGRAGRRRHKNRGPGHQDRGRGIEREALRFASQAGSGGKVD